ncbi:MAG: hypothetical protein LDL33_06945 [Desulfomonile sp.]|nr:hypothetical protein [Desulfomonile sp.]
MLQIRFDDVFRATLPVRSGNEGWIGVSPSGLEYHVVVPVDTQIARGVMACNRPTDGTPFGGFAGWTYFRCPPFEVEDDTTDETALRVKSALETAKRLILRLAERGVEAELTGVPTGDAREQRSARPQPTPHGRSPEPCRCPQCGRSWERLGAFLTDPDVRVDRYRACPDDFRKGVYVFVHGCGGKVEVPVVRLARSPFPGRSLAGTRACPGLCRYETSFASCAAVCEGSLYRRVAHKLRRS